MITVLNAERININQFELNIERLRTRSKDYPEDELFKTIDNKYLILCHTISEAGMGAYYCQQAIFRNNSSCELILNMNNFWTPHWTNNFKYRPQNGYYSTSVTCYHKESNTNPTPSIIFDIEKKLYKLVSKEISIGELFGNKGTIFELENWDLNLNICEQFRKRYAM